MLYFGGSASANGVLVSDALVVLDGVSVHVVSVKRCSFTQAALLVSLLFRCECGVNSSFSFVFFYNIIDQGSEGAHK